MQVGTVVPSGSVYQHPCNTHFVGITKTRELKKSNESLVTKEFQAFV